MYIREPIVKANSLYNYPNYSSSFFFAKYPSVSFAFQINIILFYSIKVFLLNYADYSLVMHINCTLSNNDTSSFYKFYCQLSKS